VLIYRGIILDGKISKGEDKMSALKKVAIITSMVVLLSIAGALAGVSGIAGHSLDAQKNPTNIIRFHVVANGNSKEEQELKLHVRDAVLEALEDDLSNFDNIDEARDYIKSHLETIEAIAKKVVRERGKDYDVKALFGKFQFPVKTYGFITLPSGEYEALRIIIGKGEGKNWWCILFPPLCFVDVTHGIAKEEPKLMESQSLMAGESSKKENKLQGKIKNNKVQESAKAKIAIAYADKIESQEKMPIVVKFKTADWLQAAWDKFQQSFKLAINN
jgi:stage II sporulation protein R